MRLADDVVQFWKCIHEKDSYRALQVGMLHRTLLKRENDSAEQVVSSETRAQMCAREVSRLQLLLVRQEEVRQEEVRQSGELRQVGQPNGGRPASPGGGERNRSELHQGVSEEVRRSVEAMRQREEDEIRDGMRRIGRRN